MSPAKRRSVLAISMLAVLLALTGMAWLITRQRGGPRPGEQWYLILDGEERPIGWQAVWQASDAQGSRGYEVVGAQRLDVRGGAAVQWSRWQLNPSATQGSYISVAPFGIGPAGQPLHRVTSIEYSAAAGRAAVTQSSPLGPGTLQRLIEVDESYLPDGLLRSRIVQAARTGQGARHRTVQDDALDLVELTLEPLPPQTVALDGNSVPATPVKLTWADLRGTVMSEERWYVADDSSIVLRESLGESQPIQVFRRVDFPRILERFPQAPGLRARALREHDSP